MPTLIKLIDSFPFRSRGIIPRYCLDLELEYCFFMLKEFSFNDTESYNKYLNVQIVADNKVIFDFWLSSEIAFLSLVLWFINHSYKLSLTKKYILCSHKQCKISWEFALHVLGSNIWAFIFRFKIYFLQLFSKSEVIFSVLFM